MVVSSRNQADIDQTVNSLVKPEGARVVGCRCDVREADQVEALVGCAVESLGRLDILVNNAGIGIFRSVAELQPKEWRAVLATCSDGLKRLVGGELLPGRFRHVAAPFLFGLSKLLEEMVREFG